jgi:3-dehydroquinate dehydratase I
MKNNFLAQLAKHGPLLVAALDGDDLAFLMEEAKRSHADAVEIRLDLWGGFLRDEIFEKMARLREKIGLPMIVSFRGGHPFPSWWQPVYWRALGNAALIDVEWNPKYPWRDIIKNVRKFGSSLMISHHDFARTPPAAKLAKIARAAYQKKADVVKIATRVQDEEDVRALFALNGQFVPKRLMTVMGMGPLGNATRLAAPIFQSCLIYGFIGRPTANGQLPYKELQERIRRLYPRYDQEFQERLKQSASAISH